MTDVIVTSALGQSCSRVDNVPRCNPPPPPPPPLPPPPPFTTSPPPPPSTTDDPPTTTPDIPRPTTNPPATIDPIITPEPTRSTNRRAIAIGTSVGGVVLLAAAFTGYLLTRNRLLPTTGVSLPDTPPVSTATSQNSAAMPVQWQPYGPQAAPNVSPHSHPSFTYNNQLNTGDPWNQDVQPGGYQPTTPSPTSFSSNAPMRPNVPEI